MKTRKMATWLELKSTNISKEKLLQKLRWGNNMSLDKILFKKNNEKSDRTSLV